MPDVWLASIDALVPPLCEPNLWLDVRERERYHRFTQPDAARRFLLGRMILKSVIATAHGQSPLAITLEYSANGKPMLAEGARPFFSITHSADAVAVAFAPFAIGLDIESTARSTKPWERPQAFLHAQAAQRVVAAHARERAAIFTQHWTCQEAAVKLLDASVFQRQARVVLTDAGTKGVCAGHDLCFSSWWPCIANGTAEPFASATTPKEFVLSVAARRPVPQVVFHAWDVTALAL